MKNVALAGILLFCGCLVKDYAQPSLIGYSPYPSHAAYWRFPIAEYDTMLPSGKYLDYWLLDSIIMINWGSKETGDIGTMVSERMPGWAPHYYWCEFENYIGVRHSCGSPCWSLTLLPINKNDSIISVMEDLVIDTKRGYILANGCPEENGDYCLLDLSTQKHHPITLPGLRWEYTITEALDTADFTQEGLRLQWHRECDYGSGFEPVDTLILIR